MCACACVGYVSSQYVYFPICLIILGPSKPHGNRAFISMCVCMCVCGVDGSGKRQHFNAMHIHFENDIRRIFTYHTTTYGEQERMIWIGEETYWQQLDRVESHVTHVSHLVVRVIAKSLHSSCLLLFCFFIEHRSIVCTFKIHRFSKMNDGSKICLRTNCVTAIISTRINSQLSIESWKKKFPLLRLLHVIEWNSVDHVISCLHRQFVRVISTVLACVCSSATMVECEHLLLSFDSMYLVMPLFHFGTACHICNILWNRYLFYIKFSH